MDLEKLIFIILAIGLSIFSMYAKSKKQKQSVSEKGESEPDLFSPEDSFIPPNSDEFSEEFDVTKLLQNFNFVQKNPKKQHKVQNLEKTDTPQKTANNILQNNDIKDDNVLLGDFDGTEIQKAFLYSEIFKSTKN